jgi:sucrose phosphorylase
MLALVGVPGIYFHSLFGSRGWPEGVKLSGRARTINRQKCERAALERELGDPASLRHVVFERYAQLLKARAASPAFHPYGAQRVVRAAGGEAVFALLRTSPDGAERVLCLHNVSGRPQPVEVGPRAFQPGAVRGLVDLIGGRRAPLSSDTTLRLGLAPYQVSWLKLED